MKDFIKVIILSKFTPKYGDNILKDKLFSDHPHPDIPYPGSGCNYTLDHKSFVILFLRSHHKGCRKVSDIWDDKECLLK